MNSLVIAEHDGEILKIATLNAVTAATKLGGEVDILVAGANIRPVAELASKVVGVMRVLVAEDEIYAHGLAEPLSLLVAGLAKHYSSVVLPATSFGKNVAPRVAALLDVQQISEVSDIVSHDTFVRPIYAGNALATVKSMDTIKVLTVRCTSFAMSGAEGGSAVIETVSTADNSGGSTFVGQQLSKSNRPDLTAAKIIISGGRGMGSTESFKLIEAVADRLGAAIGASRAAVDAGFVSNDLQIGQTGKIVAPDLYIAVGISGAIQHLAGMKDSKIIVAINKDEEAPIFQIADYGLVADLFLALPQLEQILAMTRSTEGGASG